MAYDVSHILSLGQIKTILQTLAEEINARYKKPSTGIPASDLASGVIPSVPSAYTSNPAMDGTASPGESATTAYAKGDHVHPTDTSRAPTSHASADTTYGTGTSSNYGHVKLSDSTSSASGTSGGVAATPAAVKAAYDLAAGKSTLPSISSGDNGKVLMVVNSAWAAASLPVYNGQVIT